MGAVEKFKDALLASLYSQIEFLRSELIEKNYVIKSLLNLFAMARNPAIPRSEPAKISFRRRCIYR